MIKKSGILILMIIGLILPILQGCTTGRVSRIGEIPLTEVKVQKVVLETDTMRPILILQNLDETISLTMWIGSNEAFAIASQIEDVHLPRPMTHDLLKNILHEVKASVVKVAIVDFKEDIYYAVIILKYRGKTLTIDSRPSDAIALALRTKAPIFASTEILNSKGIRTKGEGI